MSKGGAGNQRSRIANEQWQQLLTIARISISVAVICFRNSTP